MKILRVLLAVFFTSFFFASCTPDTEYDEIENSLIIEQPAGDDGDDDEDPPQPCCN